MYKKIINLLKDKKIAILGFGVEGKSTYKFIRKFLPNQELTIIDQKDVSQLDILKDDNLVNTVSGSNYLDNLEIYDLIIKTPGITFKDIDITKIKNKITSQLELLLSFYKQNVIGVTGTKGKSTTSSLIYEVLKEQQKDAYLLGNIGNPILDDIEKFNENTLLVVEMSSHQLEFINTSPHYGVILNLFQDHLDHAGSVEHYHACKMNMLKYQDSNDIGIYSSDNENLLRQVSNYNLQGQLYTFSDKLNKDKNAICIDGDNITFNDKKLYDINSKRNLIGRHNLNNIMVVLLLSELLNLDINKATKTINKFKPLSYRLENIGTYDDITYYCDTIATIPEATIAAVTSLEKVNTLIFGGMDRGIDYDSFVNFLNICQVENIVCMPTTGTILGKKINNKKVYFVETLEQAVKVAKEVTKKDMICLLSPAAPSYEYYKNFEEKGKAFQKIVTNNFDNN